MNLGKKIAVLLVVSLLLIMPVFALPIIESFRLQYVFPDQIQVNWKINDSSGLKKLELFKDGDLIFDEDLTGKKQTSLYQLSDDNKTHTYELIVYNTADETARASKTGGADETPPVISSYTSSLNERFFRFITNEPSLCRAGLSNGSMNTVEKDYNTNHSIALTFFEGANKVYLRCADEMGNIWLKPEIKDFTLDTTAPGKASEFSSTNDGEIIKITWKAPDDNVDHYNIYNSLKKLDETDTNVWGTTTNDSIYFITAVDKAGNEGEKAEYNVKRELLLKSDLEAAKVTKTEEVKEVAEDKPASTTSVIAWTTFAVLLVFFFGWKIYEYKSDKHGLRRYMKHRRKMRPTIER